MWGRASRRVECTVQYYAGFKMVVGMYVNDRGRGASVALVGDDEFEDAP